MENLHPQVVRRVMREVTELSRDSPEGIKVILNEDDITDIQATIEGPGCQCVCVCVQVYSVVYNVVFDSVKLQKCNIKNEGKSLLACNMCKLKLHTQI